MSNDTEWTPFPDDNLLGITDKSQLNEYEAKGLAMAELFVFELDSDTLLSTGLILTIHKIAFGELYNWAGKWRTVDVRVGQLVPPPPNQVLQLMYQFIDNLNFKLSISRSAQEHLDCLIFAHYEFIKIHPFNNGNGRTGRILMNIVALKMGYQPLQLYYREGESRKAYIKAMKAADRGDYVPLNTLIGEELIPF